MNQQKMLVILIGLTLISCDPFHEDRVLNYMPELNNIVNEVQREHIDISWFDSDDIPEITSLDVDIIVRNDNRNREYLGFVEENDSLIILVQKAGSILDAEKRIIYDFAKIPRNFGSEKIAQASYNIVQLNERWYFSTEGFD